MRGYDYLLYDNRTRSTLGRDWGLKAATGELAARTDLKQRFYDYCTLSFDTSRGSLANFDHAVGGLRDPLGRGYLLCVTFESRDHLERPSCTIVGLWLPRRRDLGRLLRDCDPVASARRLTSAGTAPQKLAPVGDGLAAAHARTDSSIAAQAGSRTGLVRKFRPGSTPDQVLQLLDRSAATPPSVLGVTALVAADRFRTAGFDLVFCRPPDAVSRSALDRILTGEPAAGAAPGRQVPAAGGRRSRLSRWRSALARLTWGSGR